VSKEGAEVTSAGRAFQTRAPATEKTLVKKQFVIKIGPCRPRWKFRFHKDFSRKLFKPESAASRS